MRIDSAPPPPRTDGKSHLEDFLERDHIPGPVWKLPKSSPRKAPNKAASADDIPNAPSASQSSPRSASKSKTLTQCLPQGHPANDRTAWMLGAVRNDIAYYREIADLNGPDVISPNAFALTRPNPPRAVMPPIPKTLEEDGSEGGSKSPRRRFDQTASSTSSSIPSPTTSDESKLDLKLPNINVVKPQAPAYSFAPPPKATEEGANANGTRTKSPQSFRTPLDSFRNTRCGFITGSIRNGFLYHTVSPEGPPRPDAEQLAQSLEARVNRKNKDENLAFKAYCLSTYNLPPRPRLPKGPRFAAKHQGYRAGLRIRHMPVQPGEASPGPKYLPTVNEFGKAPSFSKAEGRWLP